MVPKVSICIPAFNRRGLFRATLWSVLQQTFRDFEVVVSDNASHEDLEADVASFRDSRVRYVRQKENIGGAANFVFLQTQARGEYVLFLCSDDLLLPDCLAKAVAALDAHPGKGGVVYKSAHYGDKGFEFLSTIPHRDHAGPVEYRADASVRTCAFASPSLCLYRTSVFLSLGGWDPALLAVIDWEMYSRVIRLGGGVLFLHDVLAIMRLHDDRMSNTTALHWDFYHDAMKLAARPEHRWGGAYQAMAVMEQLLWDWRLRRSPRRTLRHAWQTGAILAVLLYLPRETMRRVVIKAKAAARRKPSGLVQAPSQPTSAERAGLDAFWRASELVRTGR